VSKRQTVKKKAVLQISEILEVGEPEAWVNKDKKDGHNTDVTWIKSLVNEINEHEMLGLDLSSIKEGDVKQVLVKKICDAIQPDHGLKIINEKNGSTVIGSAYELIADYLFEKIKQPELTSDLKSEIMDNIQHIYENSESFLNGKELLQFEEDDFTNFGKNYNWLKSLKPIWKCLYPETNIIKWNDADDSIFMQVMAELVIDEDEIIGSLENINSHLSSARSYLDAYNINLEEYDISKKKCKALWAESWDERASESGVLEPVKATVDQWKISDFIYHANKGHLDIDPIYQRDDVWKRGKQQFLMDSILLGIPLPSIILYENEDGKYQIIDGKQRTTAILKFAGRLPKANEFMIGKMKAFREATTDQLVLNQDDGELVKLILTGGGLKMNPKIVPRFKKWRKDKTYGLIGTEDQKIDKKFLPYTLGKGFEGIKGLEVLAGKYYHEIRDEKINHLGKELFVHQIFEEQVQYVIPVIIYDKKTKPRQIRRVFQRYNTQGETLNATEINNATYQSLVAMKFIMAMSRIRPERGEEMLPGIYERSIESESEKIEDFFTACQVKDDRFKWAKLISQILSLLFHETPRTKKKGHEKEFLKYPSTKDKIRNFLNAEENRDEEERKIKRTDGSSVKLASIMGDSVDSLHSELVWNILLENPNWYNKDGKSSWNEPPLISIIVASIICHSAGVDIGKKIDEEETYQTFEEYIKNGETLGQTQSWAQWGYYAETVTQICNIFGVSKDNYEDKYDLFSGYNALTYFDQINIENYQWRELRNSE